MTAYDHLVKRVNAVDSSKSVKKADYDTKVLKKKNEENNCDHDSYITTPESNKPTKTKFDKRLKQFSKLSKQNDIADFMKEAYFNEKLRK